MTFETFIVGILLALVYVETLKTNRAGLAFAVDMATNLDRPERVLATLLVALLSLYSYRALARYLIVFGKRRFALLVLLGVLGSQIMVLVLPDLIPTGADVQIIGWIIPGLLANNLEKQRLVPTLASLLTVSVATYFIVGTLSWF